MHIKARLCPPPAAANVRMTFDALLHHWSSDSFRHWWFCIIKSFLGEVCLHAKPRRSRDGGTWWRCYDVAARNRKRGHCSHRSPFLSPKLRLPLKLIRFWYQAIFSHASLPLQHAWNCTALSIIYSPSFAYCFSWMPPLRHLQLCRLPIRRSSPSPSALRHTSSAGLSPTHLLVLVGELWIFFSLSPPFTQWQHGEVLWGLGANELTLQCWGRCSVARGGVGWRGGVRGLSRQGRSGTRRVRGAIMAVPDRGEGGLDRTSQTESPKSDAHCPNVRLQNAILDF